MPSWWVVALLIWLAAQPVLAVLGGALIRDGQHREGRRRDAVEMPLPVDADAGGGAHSGTALTAGGPRRLR